MSHYISVFFFPIGDDEIPDNLESWHSAEKLLRVNCDNRERNELRTSVSRNWWHQHAIGLICEYLQISGLEFLKLEIACLDMNEIQAGISAINEFLTSCRHGLPELTPDMEKEGSIWFLRNYFEGNKERKFSTSQVERAYAESCDVPEVKGFADIGYDSLVGFFSFLKSLRASLQECLSQNKKFLYVQPQP